MKRRKFLQAGSILAGSSLGGIAGARNSTNKSPYEATSEELRQLLREEYAKNRSEGLKKVMRNHNRDYELITRSIEPSDIQSKGSPDAPAPQWNEGESEVAMNVWEDIEDNRIWAQVFATLEGWYFYYFNRPEWVSDVIGLSFNGSHWSVVAEPIIYVMGGSSIDAEISWYTGSLSGNGLAARVDYSGWSTNAPSIQPVLSTRLQNLDGVTGTVFGSYTHTSAPIPTGTISNITAGTDGPINVQLDLESNIEWDIASPASTDGLIP